MDLGMLVRGFVIGLLIAIPVGPIGLLCIQRTLNEGRAVGLASGLGAATADATYGLIAAFGLTLISSFLIEQRVWLALIGGAFLVYLGVRTLLTPPATQAAQVAETRSNLLAAWGSTFLLTMTNPMTILSFVAIFAGAGLAAEAGNWLAAGLMVAGVFLGSAAWWFVLSGGVALLRRRVTPNVLLWVNRGAGALILVFAATILWSTVRG